MKGSEFSTIAFSVFPALISLMLEQLSVHSLMKFGQIKGVQKTVTLDALGTQNGLNAGMDLW